MSKTVLFEKINKLAAAIEEIGKDSTFAEYASALMLAYLRVLENHHTKIKDLELVRELIDKNNSAILTALSMKGWK